MYFLIKSTSAFSSENSEVCVSARTGDGTGVSSGKIVSDGCDVFLEKCGHTIILLKNRALVSKV